MLAHLHLGILSYKNIYAYIINYGLLIYFLVYLCERVDLVLAKFMVYPFFSSNGWQVAVYFLPEATNLGAIH